MEAESEVEVEAEEAAETAAAEKEEKDEEGLQELPPLPLLIKRVLLCADSWSALHLLSRGREDQQASTAQRVWTLLDALTTGGRTLTLHWVLSHADIAANNASD